MIRKILLTLAATLTWVGASPAHQNHAPMETNTARDLISRIQETRLTNVTVGSITYGNIHTGNGFEHHRACRVTAVVQVPEKGVMVMRVRHYDFLWNNTYGWFHQYIHKGSNREWIEIWSELKGDFTVK